MRDILLRPQFQSMKISPKISLLQDLAERYEMNLLSLFSFARWGQSCTTGVFEKDRRIWVFVPGDKVTLGWKEFVQGMGEDNQIELREILQELEYPGGILDYLPRCVRFGCRLCWWAKSWNKPAGSRYPFGMYGCRKSTGIGWNNFGSTSKAIPAAS